MNIINPITFRWNETTHRADGQQVSGEISYVFEISKEGTQFLERTVSVPTITVVPLEIPLRPGKYRATVRTIETTIEEVHRSQRSDPFIFVLESFADPLPPTGLGV